MHANDRGQGAESATDERVSSHEERRRDPADLRQPAHEGRGGPVGPPGEAIDALPGPDVELWLRPCTDVRSLDDSHTVVFVGDDRRLIEGREARLTHRMLERLRSGATTRELLAEAVKRGEAEVTRAILRWLWDREIIDRSDAPRGSTGASVQDLPMVAFLSRFSSRPVSAARQLGEARVTIFGRGRASEVIVDALTRAGVGRVDTVGPDDATSLPGETAGSPTARDDDRALALVIADRVERAWAQSAAAAAIGAGTPTLGGFLSNDGVIVGPLSIPGQSACLRCVLDAETGLRAVNPGGVEIPFRAPDTVDPPFGAAEVLGGLLALEALRLVSRVWRTTLVGRRLVMTLVEPDVRVETVVRRPRCPVCSRDRTSSTTASFEHRIGAATAVGAGAPGAAHE